MTTLASVRLSIVILTYNNADVALRCLTSVRDNVRLEGVEVVVFDNGSDSFDPSPFREAYSDVVIGRVATNLRPAGGYNAAVQGTSGPYVMLLNSDTLVPADHHVEALVAFLDTHPDYAAVTPLLTDPQGRVQPWQTGHFPALWRMVLSVPARVLARQLPSWRRYLGVIETDHLPLADRDVEVVAAAALTVRRACFDAVGGFCTDYSFYLEDSDLCRSLHALGFRIRWLVGARIVHLWTPERLDSEERRQHFRTSQEVYFRRWKGVLAMWALRALRYPYVSLPALEHWRHLDLEPVRRAH